MHAVDSVNRFLDKQGLAKDERTRIDQALPDMANDRNLLTAVAIVEVLGQDLSWKYFERNRSGSTKGKPNKSGDASVHTSS